MPGPAYAIFGNTLFSEGFDFTLEPGVAPSVCFIRTVPHTSSLPSVADLALHNDGAGPPLVLRQCLLEQPRLEAGQGGQHWTLPVKDRRWKWVGSQSHQWGAISGHYNKRKADATYIREKTPQELASLLLDAMGESGYDISRMPTLPRPEVHWQSAQPASELDRLCQSLGCLVAFNPFLDRAEVWPVGEGAALPIGGTRGASFAPVLPARPERIRIEAAATLFQGVWKLEAVGLDTDGTWKPIDELSYTPAMIQNGWPGGLGGWRHATPDAGFPEVGGTYLSGGRRLQRRDLAEQTVYRCYRITGLAHLDDRDEDRFVPPLVLDENRTPQSRRDVRLFDTLVDEEIDPADGGLRRLPARVYAHHFHPQGRVVESTAENPALYAGAFSLLAEHGIVQFSEPLYRLEFGNKSPAVVRFECAFHVGRNGVQDGWLSEVSLGTTWQSPPRIIQRREIQARVVLRYGGNDGLRSVVDNIADTNERLSHWSAVALREYVIRNGGTVRYADLRAITPDGLTFQVTWSGGGRRTVSTTVSQSQRHNRFTPPLDEYRDRMAAKRAEQATLNIAQALSPLIPLGEV